MNALGAEPEIGSFETLRLLGRALRYLQPYAARVLLKLLFGVISLAPLLLLPWPVKILVDQVVEGIPIAESRTPFPFFVRPLVAPLEQASPEAVVAATVGFQALLLLLVGAIGTSSRENDQTDAYLASGHDAATRTENEANAGFSLAGGLIGWIDFRWTIRLVQDLNHHYRAKLFERIHSLPMAAFDDERIGDAVFRVMYDSPSITNGCFRIVLTPVLGILTILATAAVFQLVFGSHPWIVAAALGLLPIAFLGSLPFAARLRRSGSEARQAGSTTTSTVEEGLSNILAVQSLGGEERERQRFDRDSWSSFSAHRRVMRTAMAAFVGVGIPAFALLAWTFLGAVDLVIEGRISRGDFTLFFTYAFIIAGAAFEIGAMWFRVQTSAAGLQRVFFLMDLPGESDAPDARPLPRIRHSLRLEEVSFEYPDGVPAVQDVSLELRPGRITALVGPAGAGKTTLAYLLCGYRSPTRGRVLLDDRDLRSGTRESLRQQIAFVFQETALFDDSVEANLRLGRPEATELELRQAARTAGADGFIQQLPEGYRTRLGRAGGKLSVGQKQRLAIARALVRAAPILVLDEPTSALDPETEQQLVRSLREASRERAVLVIAHRLSTVRAADEILFVDSGRIVERGSHEALMQREGGAYRRFVELSSPFPLT